MTLRDMRLVADESRIRYEVFHTGRDSEAEFWGVFLVWVGQSEMMCIFLHLENDGGTNWLYETDEQQDLHAWDDAATASRPVAWNATFDEQALTR